ncbi:electron transfer flavoprotein beta subunit/FixA family protein, partial [Propionibacterium freudenreichii]|nr:electron transfer flavoprotein beta subunit/FixA family protein [Propionibacterium freudenreichii]
MTIVVAYKYAPNPQDAEVRGDGTVDWSRAKSAVSEYDPVAVQLGRELAGDAEVVGISVGGADVASSMAKKNAMSRGLDRGLVVADDAAADWNA